MTDVGASLSTAGQPVLDIHTDPDSTASAGTGGGQHDQAEKKKKYQFRYTTLQGYFLQDDLRTKAAEFDFMKTNFGLIQRPYDSDETLPDRGQGMTAWQRFEHHITSLNDAAGRKRHGTGGNVITQYKLLFLARHGNGYHNIAERYYGGEAWDCYYSMLDGDPDGVTSWSDAHLSKEGRRQAKEVNDFWRSQLAEQKMSLPQSYYVSPLDRALETAEITFDGLLPFFNPTVIERLREGTGIHTCDRRSVVSYIRQRYPDYIVTRDPFLTETDQFWDAELRETDDALAIRLGKLLDQVMVDEIGERISFTSHSGAIGAILHVLGHRQFSLGTGAVIPVFVRVDKVAVDADGRDRLSRRHGGKAEGGKPAQSQTSDNVEKNEEYDDNQPFPPKPDLEEEDDKSSWQPKPPCPPGLDLANVGLKRWGLSLKDFLTGVENGTVKLEEVAFRYAA
ncbi:hypothetical protein A1O3_01868 [Capronia epimyces CBS 606.96]|uniref:Phosphoglycerate mutase n=1 Tax=Capronia epimyces CBS 606.96 TaxID=1182542 RepID=W9Z2Q9_9EURO|nr:uncharacterized protein A1O3_01868 [Capronia epimyces CBS 606.96]EXJ88804.1 hypothetical protein A1O3_01868 [Capronia epimyces CBS 606.96]